MRNKTFAYIIVAVVLLVTLVLELIWINSWPFPTVLFSIILLISELFAGVLVIYVGKDFDTGSIALAHYGLRVCSAMGVISLLMLVFPALTANRWVISGIILIALYFFVRLGILYIAVRHQREANK